MFRTVEQLTMVRRQLSLTQDQFAKKLGVSRQYISKLENSSKSLSSKLAQKLADVSEQAGIGQVRTGTGIRPIPVRSWAQAGTGADFGELPLDWERRVATDCPDEQAFAVEIQGDSMEPKFFPGDIAVLMPSHQPRNGSLVVARLEAEGVVFKVFTAKTQEPIRLCTFTSYNPVFQPIEVPEARVIWNYPVYQVIRQVWR